MKTYLKDFIIGMFVPILYTLIIIVPISLGLLIVAGPGILWLNYDNPLFLCIYLVEAGVWNLLMENI